LVGAFFAAFLAIGFFATGALTMVGLRMFFFGFSSPAFGLIAAAFFGEAAFLTTALATFLAGDFFAMTDSVGFSAAFFGAATFFSVWTCFLAAAFSASLA
jgi:hypothetical protein